MTTFAIKAGAARRSMRLRNRAPGLRPVHAWHTHFKLEAELEALPEHVSGRIDIQVGPMSR